MRRLFAILASSLLLTALSESAAAADRPDIGSVSVAESCYSANHASQTDLRANRSAGDEEWLTTDIVQMSLRQISLLADAEPLIHGYQIAAARQTILVIHHPAAEPDEVTTAVADAMLLGVADIDQGGTTDFPTVLVYRACRAFDTVDTFDELHESVASSDFTDSSAPETKPVVALKRDLAATQLVVTMWDRNPSTERIAADLTARFGDDIRIVVDPTHPRFNQRLLALPGHGPDGSDEVADSVEISPAARSTIRSDQTYAVSQAGGATADDVSQVAPRDVETAGEVPDQATTGFDRTGPVVRAAGLALAALALTLSVTWLRRRALRPG